MLNGTATRRLCAILSIFLITALYSSTTVEARTSKVCKPGLLGGQYHFHHGHGDMSRSKDLAKKSAARSWSSFTEWEYGRAWANIRRAVRVHYDCKRLGSRSWRCEVEAVPCAGN